MLFQHNARTNRMARTRSAITDFATAEGAIIAGTSATVDGLATGILALDAKIMALQNSPGTLSPGDQAALDGIVASSNALAAKAAAISTADPSTAV